MEHVNAKEMYTESEGRQSENELKDERAYRKIKKKLKKKIEDEMKAGGETPSQNGMKWTKAKSVQGVILLVLIKLLELSVEQGEGVHESE